MPIPDGVTTIGIGAFAYCTNLTSVVIPDTVKSIDGNAFVSCTSLTNVVIGYGAHENPAGTVLEALGPSRRNRPVVVASVTGTETDPQVYSRQAQQLRSAGVVVAGSNAAAALVAATVVGGGTAKTSRQVRT